MNNVSVDVESTSFNINKQSTKSFSCYTRSIINMHKWHIFPPEYIMVDLKCGGSLTTANQGQAYLMSYGIKGNHSDVPADVYDKAFIFENNKMVMETDLDMTNCQILNYNNKKYIYVKWLLKYK